MKDILKLIKEYKVTKRKKEHLLVLLERSRKVNFPVYSLIQILNSTSKKTTKIVSYEGWIEKNVDLKIEKLQKERNEIAKEKVDLKKAQLEFEKTLKEEKAKAKQITSLRNKDNLNFKNRNTLKKTSKENNREKVEVEQITGDQGNENSNTISVNTNEQITINNQFNHEAIQAALKILIIGILALLISFSQLIGLGLILGIITLVKYRKWKILYNKSIIPSSILKNYLSAGRICAYISLVIVIIKIINTNIESFK